MLTNSLGSQGRPAGIGIHQTLTVLGEGRGVPGSIVRARPHEPAERKGVLDPLATLAPRPNRERARRWPGELHRQMLAEPAPVPERMSGPLFCRLLGQKRTHEVSPSIRQLKGI
jgi:hypothetical protein